MPSILVVQHLEPEAPYAIADACRAAGVDVVVHRSDLAGNPPALDGHCGLVIMGGPMSARSDDGFPTRKAELDLAARAVEDGVPVLGVCLGAQLLAAAAGGSVLAGEEPEIGWGTVSLTDAAGSDALFAGCPDTLSVLHWHGETFELPVGAVRLAASEQYQNQAFRVGDVAWGLQFHVEVDASAVRRFAEAFPEEACLAPDLLDVTDARLDALAPWRDRILHHFATCTARLV